MSQIFSFFFTLGINTGTEVSKWLTTKNEELRRWLEKISFASWNYETDLSEENAEKVRLMNLIKRWISEAFFNDRTIKLYCHFLLLIRLVKLNIL